MSDPVSRHATDSQVFSGQIIFLVYDSRSGSTLFSRELARTLPDVIVSPEFRINALLRLDEKELCEYTAEKLLDLLQRNRGLQNLELDREKLVSLLEVSARRRDHESILRAVLGNYVSSRNEIFAPVFIIKKGTHLRVWKRIAQLIPASKFIHIYRDPRAVINSKLATPRPYYPREKMAWGGAFLAALQWREYSRQMRTASRNVQVLDVKYERFLSDPEAELARVANFLSAEYAPEKGRSYAVPKAERGIHTRVDKKMDKSRASAWKTEMQPRDIAIVNLIAGSEMSKRGYEANQDRPLLISTLALFAGMVESIFRILVHFPYVWIVNRTGGNR